MDDENLFCICRTEYSETRFMIECYACKEWYHGDCVGVLEKDAEFIEEYYCASCQVRHGPCKLKGNNSQKSHKPDEFDLIEHPAIKNFYQALDDTVFLNSSHIVTYMTNGTGFTSEFVYSHTLHKPILIENIVGLGLIVPKISSSKDLMTYLGPHHVLNAHDILEHEEKMIRMSEWTRHFDSKHSGDDNISIVDKLDISGTKLGKLIKSPKVLKQFDLVEAAWPKGADNEDFVFEKPKQSVFISMGDTGSVVDFQLGMVGGATWIYNLVGSRTFYLVPPTDENLKIFEDRTKITSCDDRFFGDLANACYKLVTQEKEFVFIPGGWIFASYVNSKSICLSGELCNIFSLPQHVNCFELQKRQKSLNTLRYPHFEVLVWCAAEHTQSLLSSKDIRFDCHGLINSAKTLIPILRKWISKKEEHLHAQEIPPHINPTKLINSIGYSIGKINRNSGVKSSPPKIRSKPGPSRRLKSPDFHPEDPSLETSTPAPPKAEKLSIKFNKSLLYSEQNNSAEANVSPAPIKLRLPKMIMSDVIPKEERIDVIPKEQRIDVIPKEQRIDVIPKEQRSVPPFNVTKSGRKRKRPKSLADFVDSTTRFHKPLYDSDDSFSEAAKILCDDEKPEIEKIRKRLKEKSEQKQSSVSSPVPPVSHNLSTPTRKKGHTFNEDSPDEFESEKFLSKCKQDDFYIYPTIGSTEHSDDTQGSDFSVITPLKLKVKIPNPLPSRPTPPTKTPTIKNKKGLRTPKQRLGKILKIDKSYFRR